VRCSEAAEFGRKAGSLATAEAGAAEAAPRYLGLRVCEIIETLSCFNSAR